MNENQLHQHFKDWLLHYFSWTDEIISPEQIQLATDAFKAGYSLSKEYS